MPSAHTGSRYARHAPERTLLYALVEAHYPDFIARIEAEGRSLPGYVREAFDAYLRCGVLEHGFLRVVCEHCRAERLVAFSCKKRGFCPSCGARRMAESARHQGRVRYQLKTPWRNGTTHVEWDPVDF
ncbi:transposase zinc-binding domain-containing protein, partial [Escherichia coli]|uniref:transposase zinc-binding domain-containing protein n=1 Tax=Escherichia coli TaxID=562 RepID=UPI003EE1D807